MTDTNTFNLLPSGKLRTAKLDFWVKNNFNVILSGIHGVGKTAMVVSAFKRAGLKYRYFSAATMDPWVDFLGVPKEKTDDSGNSYLEMIRPKEFSNDEVEAVFFDEFNRAPAKIRNAVMEFIQFRSINGRKFNNLKIIWAAINPYDEDATYDVEKLDPAQLDRFPVQATVPYEVDIPYFKDMYQDKGVIAATWWTTLSTENKKLISPRRLEDGLVMFLKGGDVRDVFPKKIAVSDFVRQLNEGSYLQKLQELFDSKDKDAAREALDNENFFSGVSDKIVTEPNYLEFFFDTIPEEKLASLISSNKDARETLLDTIKQDATLRRVVEGFIQSRNMKPVVHSQFVNWLKTNYANDVSIIRDELNTEINSLLKSNPNADEKLKLLYKLSNDVKPWYKQPKITDNICRLLCYTLATTQDSTLRFKRLDYPETPSHYINRLLHLVGDTEFADYVTKHRGQLQSKFGGRFDRISRYISGEYEPMIDTLEIQFKDEVDELMKIALSENAAEAPNIIELPKTPKVKKPRGRPKAKPSMFDSILNRSAPKPASSYNNNALNDLLRGALKGKKVKPLVDTEGWEDVKNVLSADADQISFDEDD
jgi:hypothetical protein